MKWTEAELYLLRELYPDLPACDVAALLDRKVGAVHQAAARYGLKKSAQFMQSDMAARILRGRKQEAMKASQFKPGHATWNKGLAGWCPAGSEQGHFKPGHVPKSWVPEGSYRITKDGTLQIKANSLPGPSNVRWKPVARIAWEAAYGPIPDGALIVFKLGGKTTDPALITADKLECITRKENAQRNHPRNKSPELGRLYQLRGAITRQVNRIIREHNEPSQHQPTARHLTGHPR